MMPKKCQAQKEMKLDPSYYAQNSQMDQKPQSKT